MKTIKNYIILLFIALGVASCNFLDVVPDEVPTDKDAFLDANAAQRYIYSCYSYMPNPCNGPYGLDFMTGDEVITAFEHETFSAFPKGNYSASNPVISYWNDLFAGIRQCYILLNNVDGVPGLDAEKKAGYKAEANFLLGYYHYLLIRCYGSTIIVEKEPSPNTSLADYEGRRPLQECIDWTVNKLDEAAANLPATRPTVEYGRATSVVAKGIKAKLLLYAASPLFNSDRFKDVENTDGTKLFFQGADPQRWVVANQAAKEAVQAAEAAGFALYDNGTYGENQYPEDQVQRTLRYEMHNPGNTDIIWADCRGAGSYGLQNKSLPGGVIDADPCWNGVAPTWNMLKRFYTEKGLPIDEDPEWKNLSETELLNIVTVPEDCQVAKPGEKTIQFNLGREPRFYAWVCFQGGYYEISNGSSNGAYDSDKTFSNGRLVASFIMGGNCSAGTRTKPRTNNYAPSCYLNKKGVDPDYAVTKGSLSAPDYPWPTLRVADLYLMLAETSAETGDLETAKTYLNRVRVHAGIPTVEESWAGVATLDQAKLRQIVRQERMTEMYLENQNFWDMRRWCYAENYFAQPVRGLNKDAKTIEELVTDPSTGKVEPRKYDYERKFDASKNYLLPIPLADVNRNPHVVQNPGY